MSEAATARAVQIPGVCRICGCSEFQPCILEATGETCAWADETRTICDFCADLGHAMHAALDQGMESEDAEEPRVVLATEGECDRFIREFRGAH